MKLNAIIIAGLLPYVKYANRFSPHKSILINLGVRICGNLAIEPDCVRNYSILNE